MRFVITNEQSINGQTPHLTLLMTSALFSEVSVTVSDNSWLQNYPTLCDQSAKQNVLLQSPHFTWWIISAQVTGMSVTVRCIYQQQLITELQLLSLCHQTTQPFLDLIVNAPFWLQYISLWLSYEDFGFDQDENLYLGSLNILITCFLDNVWILWGELTC